MTTEKGSLCRVNRRKDCGSCGRPSLQRRHPETARVDSFARDSPQSHDCCKENVLADVHASLLSPKYSKFHVHVVEPDERSHGTGILSRILMRDNQSHVCVVKLHQGDEGKVLISGEISNVNNP